MAVHPFEETQAMASASVDLIGFIKIGEMEGGSADSQHSGWSEITGVGCSIARKIGSFIKSQNPVGSTELSDVCVVKVVDGTTPKIQKACATGQKLSKVEIHVMATVNGQSKVTLEYKMEDAIVAQYAIGSGASAEAAPALEQKGGMLLERVCFSFAKISWTFHKMDSVGNGQGKIQESYTVGAS
jgi:type VI secretion system secreted protein Hcp